MVKKNWKVWLTGRDPDREDIVQALEAAGCALTLGRLFTDTWHYTEEELVEKVQGMDAIMISTGDGNITRRVMEAGKKLKVISKRAIGVGDIDVSAATDLGILVTNTPLELHYLSVAEFTVGAILGLANNLKLADYNARRGLWRSVSNTLLRNKTVGIVGLGRIGSRVAELLHPFELKLLAYDPYVPPEKAKAWNVQLIDLETLLKESDFVTLHAVETPETIGLIGEAQLRMMKPTAYLVNTARGSLIDERALARGLKESWISGAALDVFKGEIPQPDNPLLSEDIHFKTLFSPHAAALNPEVMWQLPLLQLENCLSALRGEVPEFVVNPEAIPKWQGRQ
jgi:lactate dehydrogenase-like 2-hydroxyacid dehydrogenase